MLHFAALIRYIQCRPYTINNIGGNNMKKLTRILTLTLCCLLAAGLAACGETPAPTPDPDPDPGSESPL